MPSIMLTGCHAIGKSATAKTVADLLDMKYQESPAGPIAAKIGYDLNDNPSFRETLVYQNKVYKAYQFLYSQPEHENTVYDRSPLDLATYSYLQLSHLIGAGEGVEEWLTGYLTDCLLLTTRNCSLIVHPLADLSIAYEDKHNRPSFKAEDDSRSQYANLITRFMQDVRCDKLVVPATHQYDNRVRYILHYLNEGEFF